MCCRGGGWWRGRAVKPSAPRGRADSARLAVAALLAALLHLALAQVPIIWRAPTVPPASPIRIELLPPPAAPPAAMPEPLAPSPVAPAPEAAPVAETAPVKPESKPEPPEPRRPVVTAKVSKPREPVRPPARSKPLKPKPAKLKPLESKPVEPPPEPPVRLAATQPAPASSSPVAGGGGSRDGPTGGASASTGTSSAAGEARLRPLPGNPPPRYPSLARRRGEEGQVLLRLTVNATGRVEAASVARSSGYALLDQEAQRTVARWRFQPPQAERMVAQVPITFRLRD